jgi:hypothetical protein
MRVKRKIDRDPGRQAELDFGATPGTLQGGKHKAKWLQTPATSPQSKKQARNRWRGY